MTENTKPTETGGENDSESKDGAQRILDFGAAITRTPHGNVYCLTIIGQIEGHTTAPNTAKTTKYEHVLPLLAKLEESDEVDGVLFLLNTVGGDVEAGLAIAELISTMETPVVSLVLGGGHSIGVPLACSAKYSFIAPSATMTIHPVRMSGLVLGVPQTLSYFDKMQERIVRFVTENSGVGAQRFRQLMMNTGELVMDVGTVLDGEQAVEEGLIDELGGLAQAVGKLTELIEARIPAQKKGE